MVGKKKKKELKGWAFFSFIMKQGSVRKLKSIFRGGMECVALDQFGASALKKVYGAATASSAFAQCPTPPSLLSVSTRECGDGRRGCSTFGYYPPPSGSNSQPRSEFLTLIWGRQEFYYTFPFPRTLRTLAL